MRLAGDSVPRPAPVRRKPPPRPPARRQPRSNVFGPVKAPGFQGAQHQAAQRHQQAANRAPAQLPRIPLLKSYTAPQRRVINSLMAHGVNANRLPGESAQDALHRLAQHPNPHIRQSVEIFNHTSRREYHHQRSLTYKRSVRDLKSIGASDEQARSLAKASLAGAFTPTSEAHPGPKPVHHGAVANVLGVVNAPAAALGARFAHQLHTSGATGLGGRALEDLVNVPANVIPGAYALGDALASARPHGDHGKKIRELWHQAKATDPIVHLVTSGDVHGAIKLASEHPGLTALELYGGVGAADRVLGLAARGGRAAELRPFQRVPGTNIVSPRRYSRGFVGSKIQQAGDRADARTFDREMQAAQRETHLADRSTANGDHAAAVAHHAAVQRHLERARAADPTLIRGRDSLHPLRQSDIRRRADEQEALAQGRKRPNRSATTRDFVGKRAVRPSRRQPDVLGHGSESEVQGLIAQGIVAPNREALGRYVQKLHAVHPHLADSRKQANVRLTSAIQEFLATGRDPAELVPRSLEYAKRQRAKEAEAVHARAGDAEEFRRARLKGYAVNNMDAVPDEHGRLVVPIRLSKGEHGARVAELQKVADAAEGNAARQEASGKFGLGRSNAVHMRRIAEATRAEIDQLRRNGGTVATRVLHPNEIEQHLRNNPEFSKHGIGPDQLAYVTHAPGSKDSAFNVRFMRRGGSPPQISTRHRSGRAVLEGTATHGREAMLSGPVRLQGVIDGIRSYQRSISEAAVRDKRGRVVTAPNFKRATQLRDNLMLDKNGHPLPGAVPLRIVRLNPMGGREGQLASLLDKIDAEGFAVDDAGHQSHPVMDSIQQALKGEGDGPYALIPDEYGAQLESHANVYLSSSAAWRSVTNLFRHTVLPFSPSWLQGNVTESALRTLVAGAGPRSYLTFRAVTRALAESDPAALEELLNRLGTGHLGSVDRIAVRATAAQFADSPFLPVAKAWERARERPVPKTIGNALGAYTHWMLSTVNGQMEAQFKYAMAGKMIRQNFMDGAGPKLSAKAVQQAMEGLRHTPEQVELARWVTRAYGQYEAFSPAMRRIVVNYTPFAAWSLNAVKFVTQVLPRDHPALTALIAANDNATRQWRKDHGQDAGSSTTPPFLLGSIPAPHWYAKLTGTPVGAPVRVGRYTPFGFFNQPFANTGDAILPQLSGVLAASRGETFTGAKLRHNGQPNTDLQNLLFGAKEFGFSTIPIIGQLARGAAKEGSVGARFRQVLNPLEPSHGKSAGYTPSPGTLPKGSAHGGVDWKSVDWGKGGGGQIDWGKVDWGAAK